MSRLAAEQAVPTVVEHRRGSATDPRTGESSHVTAYVLSAGRQEVELLSLGATLWRWLAPDRNGVSDNVLLTPATWEMALDPAPYFGSSIGPVAGRIADADLVVGGTRLALEPNEGDHLLHGGAASWARANWTLVDSAVDERSAAVVLAANAVDGWGGFPGPVDMTCSFRLDPDGLDVVYRAVADRPTPLAPTSHAYFNLGGQHAETIRDHRLRVLASHVVEMDEARLATGEAVEVQGSPLDLRWGVRLGDRLDSFIFEATGGVDHCYLLDDPDLDGAPVVELTHPESGRVLRLYTDQPAMTVYTGNNLGVEPLTRGLAVRHGGICLEPQVPSGASRYRSLVGDPDAREFDIIYGVDRPMTWSTRFELSAEE